MKKLFLPIFSLIFADMTVPLKAAAQDMQFSVAPSSFAFHLNGSAQLAIGGMSTSLNEAAPADADKISPIMIDPELRLRPAFNGETLGGVTYGARAELLTPYSDQGGGESGKFGSSESSTRGIAFNRAYGYVGTPGLGVFRVGLTDSAFTLLQTGVIEAFGDGAQWTLQGGPAALLPRNAAPTSTFIYADQPALYSTPKFVYRSPSVSGATFAIGFEPAAHGIKEGYSPNGSSPVPLAEEAALTDIGTKRVDTFDGAASYAGSSSAMQYKVSASVLHGSARQYHGRPIGAPHLDALSVFQLGGQIQYAGLTLGGNLKTGQVEDGYALVPKGGRNALAFIVGADYQMGPVIVGASYFNAQSAGAYVPNEAVIAKTLSEYGIATGINYIFTQNLNVFVEALYGHRHQPGNIELLGGNAKTRLLAVGATETW